MRLYDDICKVASALNSLQKGQGLERAKFVVKGLGHLHSQSQSRATRGEFASM